MKTFTHNYILGKLVSIASILSIAIMFTAFTAQAQFVPTPPVAVNTEIAENTATQKNDGEMILIADVNITKANILSLEGQELTFSFSATNSYLPVANIRYGVDIFRMDTKGEAKEKLYTKVFDETFPIAQDETVVRTGVLNIPSFVTGPVVLEIYLNTTNGLPLSLTTLGDVMAPENSVGEQAVMVDNCIVQVTNAQNKITEYPLTFGVDINAQTEQLALVCDVENTFAKAIDQKIELSTYRRTLYADVIAQDMQSIVIAPGKANITIPIEVQSDPQAYVILAQIGEISQPSASQYELRYVVRGASSSIQNATLDQESYDTGDIAEVKLFVSGNADRFPGARAEQEIAQITENKLANVTITSMTNGLICGVNQGAIIDMTKPITTVSVVIDEVCPQAQVTVEISENGVILDSQIFAFVQTPTQNTVSMQNKYVSNASGSQQDNLIGSSVASKYIVIIGLILIIILFIVLLIRSRNKGNVIRGIAILFVTGVTLFTVSGQQASAATYSLSFPWYTINIGGTAVPYNYYTIVANAVSNSCEQLTVSMSSTVAACDNDPIDLAYTLNAAGATKSDTLGCGYGGPTVSVCSNSDSVTNTSTNHGTRTGSWQFAVNSLGDDTVHIDFDNANKNHSGSQAVTVAQCASPGSCGTSNGGVYSTAPLAGLCGVGVASNVTNNTTTRTWNWTCAGTSTVSCSASEPALLSATLAATPSSGILPLATVLTAGYSGGSGTATHYRFRCNSADAFSGWQINNNTYNCNYPSVGVHTAGVIVWRGTYAPLAEAQITVNPAAAVCGNNIIEAGEQCDDGVSNGNNKACNLSCQETYCGDGIEQNPNGGGSGQSVVYEQCDTAQSWCQNCQLEQQSAGTCGSAEDTVSCSAPISGLCSSGGASSPTYDSSTQRWNWTCGGTACSTVKDCSYQEVQP